VTSPHPSIPSGRTRGTPSAKVIYIAGAGRSGSTLLERILGQVPGFLPAGELKNIWNRGFTDNQLCSCGASFHDCDFWVSITRDAYGGRAIPPYERLAYLDRARNRNRYIPPLRFASFRTQRFAAELADFQQGILPLYSALAQTPGTTAIVDSSKNVPYAFLLGTLQEIDLHVVHLIRDSRAVGYSWRKRVRRPEIPERVEYMGGIHPAVTAIRWNLKNVASEFLRYSAASYIQVRYEDLVEDPWHVLTVLLESIGEDAADMHDLQPETLAPPPVYHTVSGNPIRFEHGRLPIRADIEWRTKLGSASKLITSTLTFPLLMRYGYLPSRTALAPSRRGVR
jgi:hypothetical protein